MAMALAIMPLAILNGLPIAEGCICADGHYEPVCRGHLDQSHGDRSCCAKHSCCAGMHTCHLATGKSNSQPTLGDHCCTPLVHQAVPVVSATPQFASASQTADWNAIAIESPTFLSLEMHSSYCIEVDTTPPPNDLVVTLQRLII
jgi:hypothetical protein